MSVEGNAGSTYELRGKLSGVFSNIIDNTLSIEGAGADAKATGDAINDINERLGDYPEYVEGSRRIRLDGLDLGPDGTPSDGTHHGGYIDFRFDGTSREGLNYTSRIMEWKGPGGTEYGIDFSTPRLMHNEVDLKDLFVSSDNVANSTFSGCKATNFNSMPFSVPAGGSVKFSVTAHTILIGRAINGSNTGAYVMSAYSPYRVPLVAQLAAISGITVSTSGDNTNGWYVEVKNTASQTSNFYIMGNELPNFI